MRDQVALLSGIGRPLLTLVLASMVVMGSPGPSTISATAIAAAFGFRRSLRYACGLIAGTIVVLLAVAIGVVAFLLSAPHGASALAIISAAYILYLAFRIATAPPLAAQSGDAAAPAFAGGFLLAIANPKAYLAIAAVFAGSTLFAGDRTRDAAAKILVLSVMIVVIHLCWLLAGASLSRALRDPVRSRIVNVSLAAILIIMTCLPFFGGEH
jgi:threonine/homoserine/homoserine lactone efflux protein